MSAIQREPRRWPGTHSLDRSSWQACQQSKESPGGAQALTRWIGVHGRHVSNPKRAQEVARHSQAGWEFMAGMSAIPREPRRWPGTHKLDGSLWQACQQSKESPGGGQALTSWIGVHGRHVSNPKRAQEVPRHSQAGWEFMAGMSAIQREPRRCLGTHKLDGSSWQACQQSKESPGGGQALTCWIGVHSRHVSNPKRAQEVARHSLAR
jgi:hypothetical protein